MTPFPEFNLLRKRQCCFPVYTSVSQLFTYCFQSPVENWRCARFVTVICTKLEYFSGTYGTCLKTTTKRKLYPWRPKDSPHWHLNNFPRTQTCALVFFLKGYILIHEKNPTTAKKSPSNIQDEQILIWSGLTSMECCLSTLLNHIKPLKFAPATFCSV